MKDVTVNKAELLSTLKTNRDAHRATFVEAQKKYREKVIEVLDKRLEEARNGGRIRTHFLLPEPVDYSGEYDRAIAMVEWDTGQTITLDERDFRRFVLDQWEWASIFEANTAAYVAGTVRDNDED